MGHRSHSIFGQCVQHLLKLFWAYPVQHRPPIISTSWSAPVTGVRLAIVKLLKAKAALNSIMPSYQDAVQGVKQAAASAGASGNGKLDKALKRLLLTLTAASSGERYALPAPNAELQSPSICLCRRCPPLHGRGQHQPLFLCNLPVSGDIGL